MSPHTTSSQRLTYPPWVSELGSATATPIADSRCRDQVVLHPSLLLRFSASMSPMPTGPRGWATLLIALGSPRAIVQARNIPEASTTVEGCCSWMQRRGDRRRRDVETARQQRGDYDIGLHLSANRWHQDLETRERRRRKVARCFRYLRSPTVQTRTVESSQGVHRIALADENQKAELVISSLGP